MAKPLVTDMRKLLQILGVSDDELVTKLVLTAEADDIPTVEITRVITKNDAFEEATEMFELHRREDES